MLSGSGGDGGPADAGAGRHKKINLVLETSSKENLGVKFKNLVIQKTQGFYSHDCKLIKLIEIDILI